MKLKDHLMESEDRKEEEWVVKYRSGKGMGLKFKEQIFQSLKSATSFTEELESENPGVIYVVEYTKVIKKKN
jgi:hypothetical protein